MINRIHTEHSTLQRESNAQSTCIPHIDPMHAEHPVSHRPLRQLQRNKHRQIERRQLTSLLNLLLFLHFLLALLRLRFLALHLTIDAILPTSRSDQPHDQ
jgi:hypothetical protein